MSTLISLKNKIKSIQTTQKITHAIRLSSMSVYSKLEKQSKFLSDYSVHVSNMFSQILSCSPDWKNPIFSPDDILDVNPLFIVISSSKGLCGSFNSNLFRYFERACFIEEHQVAKFITIGKKSESFIKSKKLGESVLSIDELTVSNFDSVAKEISSLINSHYEFSSVSVYSNLFKSFFVQKPHKTTLIPIDVSKRKGDEIEFLWEQPKDQILNNLALKYLNSSILNILFQSLIAENASRFVAMDSSTNNAEKLLERLILHFNKTRQTLITREVSELSVNF